MQSLISEMKKDIPKTSFNFCNIFNDTFGTSFYAVFRRVSPWPRHKLQSFQFAVFEKRDFPETKNCIKVHVGLGNDCARKTLFELLAQTKRKTFYFLPSCTARLTERQQKCELDLINQKFISFMSFNFLLRIRM